MVDPDGPGNVPLGIFGLIAGVEDHELGRGRRLVQFGRLDEQIGPRIGVGRHDSTPARHDRQQQQGARFIRSSQFYGGRRLAGRSGRHSTACRAPLPNRRPPSKILPTRILPTKIRPTQILRRKIVPANRRPPRSKDHAPIAQEPNELDSASPAPAANAAAPAPAAIPLGEAFRTWCRVAALSFGGPAGQIAVMHRIVVDEKKWVDEERFLHALNYCMLLPGPEAQQLATYIGWLLHGTRGALMAGVLFVLPGCVAILLLSILYASFEQSNLLQALFFGLKPAVLAIVLEAVIRIGRRVLKNGALVAIAAAAFVAIYALALPFPVLVVSAGVIGLVGGRIWPERFGMAGHAAKRDAAGKEEPQSAPVAVAERPAVRPSLARSLRVAATCLTLWFAPLAALGLTLGPQSVYFQVGAFFSKAAVVTFGGAYAVLAYIAQQAVEKYGWLQPGEILDGLGMAETTPGPLIMVVQFVGFLAAYRRPGPFGPLAGGIVASLLTTWVTFVPCFLWILLGAPYIERLRGNRPLGAALSAITAAVVGVILNLAIWFSIHTLFGQVEVYRAAPCGSSCPFSRRSIRPPARSRPWPVCSPSTGTAAWR